MERGGYEAVTGGKLWKDICRCLAVDLAGQTSASFNMRVNYKRCLLDFENYLACGQVGVVGWGGVGVGGPGVGRHGVGRLGVGRPGVWGGMSAAMGSRGGGGVTCQLRGGRRVDRGSGRRASLQRLPLPAPPRHPVPPACAACSTSVTWQLAALPSRTSSQTTPASSSRYRVRQGGRGGRAGRKC